MEREIKKQKKDKEEEPWAEYYTEPSAPIFRNFPYDSVDSVNSFGATTVYTYYGTEDWAEIDHRSGTRAFRFTSLLRNIRKSFDKHSTRYKQGWSPSLNFSTEAFFRNFQATYIKWSELWPITRIPLSETTPEGCLEHCCIIEVELESIEETVVEIKKTFRAVNLKARYEYTEEERVVYNAPTLPTTKGRPKEFVGHHDQNSYTGFYQLLNREEALLNHEKIEESDEQLAQCFATYTNSKGRCFDHVTLEGIDKISANYVPWTTLKPNSGANYTIRALFNTSMNHIIGTVGFTVVEYFGETAVKDSITDKYLYGIPVSHGPNSSYNIVHVVHGRGIWRGKAPGRRRELRRRNFYTGEIAPPNPTVHSKPVMNSPTYARAKFSYRMNRLYKASQTKSKYKIF
jgi:hypothetical protein